MPIPARESIRRIIIAILDNVTFAFVKIQKPVKSLNEGDTEFTVEAIVSKAAAKQWNTDHPKNKAKAVDTDDFEAKYKIPPVFDDQDSQYVIKFKKIHAKKGVELPEKFRPRVFVPVKGGKPLDVTFKTLPANGSTGKVSYSTFQGPKAFPGEFVQLDAILVEEMIDYEAQSSGGEGGGGVPGSDFGADELAEVPKGQKAVVKQTDTDDEEEVKAPVKPKKPAPKPNFSDMDDDIPFMRGCRGGLNDPFRGKYAHTL